MPPKKNDSIPPIHLMMGWAESGIPKFRDFMDLPAQEVDRWCWYAINGASQARTQMLLAQLIQLVSGLGGKPPRADALLPWLAHFDDGKDDRTAKARKKAKAQFTDMLDDVLGRRSG